MTGNGGNYPANYTQAHFNDFSGQTKTEGKMGDGRDFSTFAPFFVFFLTVDLTLC